MLGMFSAVLGLASSAASAAGTLMGSGSGSSGLAMAQAREDAENLYIQRGQAKFAETVARGQGLVGSQQIRYNAAAESANTYLSANMQSLMYEFEGKVAKWTSEYEAKFMDRQADRARVLGQQEMFELQRQLQYTQSDLTANAAASGFMADDASTSKLADDIEIYGQLQARRAYMRGETQARDIEFSADVRRLEGDIAYDVSQYQSETTKRMAKYTIGSTMRAAKLEADIFKQNKTFEAEARALEAAGYADMAARTMAMGALGARAEAQAASARQASAYGNAAATLLGGAANFAIEVPKFNKPTSTTVGASYG